MSALPHKNSKLGLDVLEHQDEDLVRETEHKVPIHKIHDFSELRQKPTDIDPMPEKPKKAPQISPYVKVSEIVKESDPKQAAAAPAAISRPEFKSRMNEVSRYLRGLKEHKKIKVLEFDLSGLERDEDYDTVISIIKNAAAHGVVHREEEQNILSILNGSTGDKLSQTEKKEISASAQLSLEKIRKEYSAQYVEWEHSTRLLKRKYIQTMHELGVVRPIPERLSKKPYELREVEKEYESSIEDALSSFFSGNAEEKWDFLMHEREILDENQNDLRKGREKKISEKGMHIWNKLPELPATHRVVLANMLLSDSASFEAHPESLSSGFSGFRAPREVPQTPILMTEQEKPEQKVEQNDSTPVIVSQAPSAEDTSVVKFSEAALLAKEKNLKQAFEKEVDTKKRNRLIKASELLGISHSLPQMEIPASHSIEVLSAGQIPYQNTFIDIVDNGIARKILLNSMEIAAEMPLGNGSVFVLLDKFQDGEKNKVIREAFSVAFEKAVNLRTLAKQSQNINFEEGKITLLYGFQSEENGIKVLLNGKEIAKGVYKLGPKVSLLGTPGIKSGWLMGDTVYERAFKKVVPALKHFQVNQ